MFAVYTIVWTEFERGWGQRPDGISYHKSKEEADAFKIKTEAFGNAECFSRGTTPTLIEVTQEWYDKTQKASSLWYKV